MRYAMVLYSEVIDILENQNEKPYWPPNSVDEPVYAIECDENVKIGMRYDSETGAFTDNYVPPEKEPTQLDNIERMTAEILEKESTLDILLGVATDE